jgi:hypothetical protein
MRTDHPREDPLVELGYEIRDVNYKALRNAVVYFFIFAVFAFAAGLGIYNWMNPMERRQTQANNASVVRRIPGAPNPLLQNNVTAKTDMMLMRKEEDVRLHGTGYVDDARTRVHIPIDRAIDLIAERGMPATKADVPAVTRGNTTDERRSEPSAQPGTTAPIAPEPTAPTSSAPASGR